MKEVKHPMLIKEFGEIREIDIAMRGLFKRIPAMTETQLVDTAVYAEKLGRQAYIIRGACVSHFLESSYARLPGGRGKRDQARQGIRAQMDDLATRTGIHRRTLEIDASIYKTFFTAGESPQTGGAHAASLSREMYVIALAAPDPQAAIKEVVERSAHLSYSRKQFRAHVRALRQADLPQQSIGRPANFVTVRARVLPEVGRALSELETWTADSTDQIVAEAVLRLHSSYRRQRMKKSRVQANTITASSNAQSAQKQLLF